MIEDTKLFFKILKKTYPDASCALTHKNALELLAATILSAQCTDKRVNEVTKTLFLKYKTARDFARADPEKLENAVRSTGFFRQKTKFIINACKKIDEEYGGKVPDSMEELLKLQGVARKTANVVLGTGFGIAAGIVVDTHVIRLSHRLELSRHDDPVKIERDLMEIVPRKNWIWFAHALVAHGRQICKAINPRCAECPLNKICPYYRKMTNDG